MTNVFKEVSLGGFALRFYPSDTGWMCGISKEMMNAICSYEYEIVPVDPTVPMLNAAINVELLDSDTGNDYQLSWEEAEQIYSAMLNAVEKEES